MRRAVTSVSKRRIKGAGLIEVLIAVLVMAVGLLGIAAMQATALRNSQSSLERSQAVIQAYSIADAMRANREVALTGAYNMGMTCAPPGAAGDLASTDKNKWISALHETLGASACGQVALNGDVVNITVRWDDRRATGLATADNKSVITQTRL